MGILAGKKIIVGISGGIAAYKSVFLLRELIRRGAEVRCLLTGGGRQFIGPLTLSALSGHEVPQTVWDMAAVGDIGHVALAHWADALVIAPASANCIARLAEGRCDDTLTLTVADSTVPVLLAPAMETNMYEHPPFTAQLARLTAYARFATVGPGVGALASGGSGPGRMSEPDEIIVALERVLSPRLLSGRHVVVSAGATREPIDPVRYISNPSSGKMGIALACGADRLGATVTLIAGHVSVPLPAHLAVVSVSSTADMLHATLAATGPHDIVIMAAAPADFMPRTTAARKIKRAPAAGRRADEPAHTLELEATPDILVAVHRAAPEAYLVGFAAETHELAQHARDKFRRKGLSLIVANDVTQSGVGFSTDTNAVTVFDATGVVAELPLQSKEDVADALLRLIAQRLQGVTSDSVTSDA
jgi:phosphopantothenoylcysteine decarboxylase / phosphopantothenate---cysteine ligase